ncbi:hypothetical protein [Flavobacterium sp. ZB4R12]|uniref:hypothetical protein n=1 Tax=Flavobacterium sp. ZB4R12 TaxID=3398732 RepID=UPI003AABBC08
MKTEITFLLLTFFKIVSTIYSQFDAQKSWASLAQTILLQSQKNMSINKFIDSLRANSGNIDSSPQKVESLIKAIRPSTPTTTIRWEFRHLQSSYFLTI